MTTTKTLLMIVTLCLATLTLALLTGCGDGKSGGLMPGMKAYGSYERDVQVPLRTNGGSTLTIKPNSSFAFEPDMNDPKTGTLRFFCQVEGVEGLQQFSGRYTYDEGVGAFGATLTRSDGGGAPGDTVSGYFTALGPFEGTVYPNIGAKFTYTSNGQQYSTADQVIFNNPAPGS